MVEKEKVLFLCTGNPCRSQMAEGFLREAEGNELERLTVFCRVRDEIQQRIHQWLKTLDLP